MLWRRGVPFLRGVFLNSLTLSPPCRRHQWSSEVVSNHLRLESVPGLGHLSSNLLLVHVLSQRASQSHAMVPQPNKPQAPGKKCVLHLVPTHSRLQVLFVTPTSICSNPPWLPLPRLLPDWAPSLSARSMTSYAHDSGILDVFKELGPFSAGTRKS